jgi:hypothetical protein
MKRWKLDVRYSLGVLSNKYLYNLYLRLEGTCLELCNVRQQINIYICIYLLSVEIILIYVTKFPSSKAKSGLTLICPTKALYTRLISSSHFVDKFCELSALSICNIAHTRDIPILIPLSNLVHDFPNSWTQRADNYEYVIAILIITLKVHV